jgi:glutamyl-Q tRNA(Asp) synthetase
MQETVTRFAPSPTGRLHLGHAFSALFAEARAREAGGRFLLRIEDIDRARCRPEFTRGILEDLAWLGLGWDGPVRRQSEQMEAYQEALGVLHAMGLLYPCFCSRADILREIGEAGRAPHGPEGPLYPGTCKALSEWDVEARRNAGEAFALRLDMAKALAEASGPLIWHDRVRGKIVARPQAWGDIVLARKDMPTSYHLSVVLDDALQGVTLVTRGADLIAATDIHRLLQNLLGLPAPDYWHHALIADQSGARLAKRDKAMSLAAFRDRGHTPGEVREMALRGAKNETGAIRPPS